MEADIIATFRALLSNIPSPSLLVPDILSNIAAPDGHPSERCCKCPSLNRIPSPYICMARERKRERGRERRHCIYASSNLAATIEHHSKRC
jgi:hypothetical protein